MNKIKEFFITLALFDIYYLEDYQYSDFLLLFNINIFNPYYWKLKKIKSEEKQW